MLATLKDSISIRLFLKIITDLLNFIKNSELVKTMQLNITKFYKR